MKKRILSLLILALVVASVFALSSCGKESQVVDCPECEKELVEQKGVLLCENKHIYIECLNEDCRDLIEAVDFYSFGTTGVEIKEAFYCPSCGTNQINCPECYDGVIDGVYCSTCGKQVAKEGGIDNILNKTWKDREGAISDSALILCKGMLGIFIVTGVIIAFILALNTIVERVRQAKENKE